MGLSNFDPADLEAAGKALYGAQWQSALAHALGVKSRRVREWVAGERKPKRGVMQDIIVLLDNNQRALSDVKRRLKRRYEVDNDTPPR